MEAMLIVWAIGTLPALSHGFVFFGLIGVVLTVIIIGACATEDYYFKKRYTIPVVVFFVCLLTTGAIIPDRNTALAMGAAYIGQNIIESPKVQELASDSVDVLSAYLQKAKKEIEQESK